MLKYAIIFAAISTSALAERYEESYTEIPEIDIIQTSPTDIKVEYYNGSSPLSMMDTSEKYMFVDENGIDKEINFHFERRKNHYCYGADAIFSKEFCADTITLFPPTGYIAIPAEATVNEGDGITFVIQRYLGV